MSPCQSRRKTVFPKPLESLLTDYLTDFMKGLVTLSNKQTFYQFSILYLSRENVQEYTVDSLL